MKDEAKANFIHLHTHSHYSLLNALPTVSELIKAAKEDEMPAIALTDAGNLYGAIQFYKECKANDIKPIIGVDAYVASRTRHDKEPRIDNKRYRLVLLAQNEKGYKNLIQLVTKSYLEGFYYKPRVDRELLKTHNEGLIAILPSFSSEVSDALKVRDAERAEEALNFYEKTFGKENLYIELTHHPEIEGHDELTKKLKTFAKEKNTQLVAAHDVYYLKPEDHLARETMVKIQTGGEIREAGGFDSKENFSFISQETAREFFRDTPEALSNTLKIAESCNLEIEMKWQFPNFIIESGKEPDEELRDLAKKGIAWRELEESKEVLSRLEYELDIIKQKEYATYFLVVGDLISEARKRNILTTIRGSVAGSLTTYLLGITNVDPLEYKIPFERFLNPERPSAPDIDMDFADNRRDEIIEYAKEKYGADKVAQIGTFGTMMARAAVRDVARALGYPYGVGDKIAKLTPFGSQGFPMTIDHALEITPELAELYKKDTDTKRIIDLAKKIEGCARHISVHAAGVVIAPRPLTEFVPLQFDPKGGKLITQYDMYSVGEDGIGLLKFDFLGIKNLAILADSVDRVKKIKGIEIDIESIPLDDATTFNLLAKGETMGLFQLNGSGMTRFLKDLQPTRIHDINAMVALYRPGPMESIPMYIERKHNEHLVHYLDPRMKEILEESYGVITYQDDVLMIANKIAGYSWLEADKLRKAMGKKIPAEMQAQKKKFIEGAISNGMTPQNAERLWKLIEPFAAYGFNKAHAASYGRVAYQTAYMKANYPVEYMASVLTADSGNVEKISEIIAECERMNIPVLPPDVNESFGDFTIAKNEHGEYSHIRFGLYSIKNFGEGIGEAIISEREEGGPYKNLADFLSRIDNRNFNKKSLEALTKSGALDQFGERGMLFANIEYLLTYNKEQTSEVENQDSLFGALPETGSPELSLESVEPADPQEKLAWEKELLGLYVSGHPLDRYRETLKKHEIDIRKVKEEMKEGMPVVLYGVIEETKPILTKSGGMMAFVRIGDFSGNIETVFFPKVFEEYKSILSPEKCIGIKGRISARGGEQSIIVERIKEMQ
ncbi:MAG: DNA polymerase III subunit alpha [Candidatus Paceibacterota bacterium]